MRSSAPALARLEVKAARQLEVELNGSALELTLERVVQVDVDLGPVEGAIGRVQAPLLAEAVQAACERLRIGSADALDGKCTAAQTHRLGVVPLLDLAEILFGPGRQRKGEFKAEPARAHTHAGRVSAKRTRRVRGAPHLLYTALRKSSAPLISDSICGARAQL